MINTTLNSNHILSAILYHCSDSDLIRSSQVCRVWNNTISSDNQLCWRKKRALFFSKIRSLSEEIQDPFHSSRALASVAEAQAKFDPAAALSTARQIKLMDLRVLALRKVAGKLADPVEVLLEAREAVNEVACARQRAWMIKNIASEMKDPEIAGLILDEVFYHTDEIENLNHKGEVHYEIAKKQAKYDEEKALETTSGIEHPHWRASAYRDRVAERVRKNPKEALLIARRIQNAAYRSSALRIVALEYAKIDEMQSRKIFYNAYCAAQAIGESYHREEALTGLLIDLAKIRWDLALKLLEHLALSDNDRIRILHAVIVRQAWQDPDAALETFHNFKNIGWSKDCYRELFRSTALTTIATARSLDSPISGLIIARKIKASRDRAGAYLSIAEVQDREIALEIYREAAAIAMKDQWILAKIAKGQARFEVQEALGTARLIKDGQLLSDTLLEIAVNQQDPAIFREAIFTAKEIGTARAQVHFLLRIAKKIADPRLAYETLLLALESARCVELSWERALDLGKVAGAIAKFQPAIAYSIMREVSRIIFADQNGWMRSMTLTALVRSQAKFDPEGALKTISYVTDDLFRCQAIQNAVRVKS